MSLPRRLRKLRDVVEAALDHYDRQSVTDPDPHPTDCSCPPCELVRSSRALVNSVNELEEASRTADRYRR